MSVHENLGPISCFLPYNVGQVVILNDPAERSAVVASGLPRAGTSARVPLKVKVLLAGSIPRLACGKANGCPWNVATSYYAAGNGHLEALRWARAHGCAWDTVGPGDSVTWRAFFVICHVIGCLIT